VLLGDTAEADELLLQVELLDVLGDDSLHALPQLERLMALETLIATADPTHAPVVMAHNSEPPPCEIPLVPCNALLLPLPLTLNAAPIGNASPGTVEFELAMEAAFELSPAGMPRRHLVMLGPSELEAEVAAALAPSPMVSYGHAGFETAQPFGTSSWQPLLPSYSGVALPRIPQTPDFLS